MSTTVEDLMTRAVTTVGPHSGLKEAAALLRSSGCSALPVVDAGNQLIGILSEADLLAVTERPKRPAGLLACHLMSRPAMTVLPDAPIADAAHLMHRHGLKRLPVVGADGRLLGIVSRGDLLKVFLRSDDELRRDVERRLREERLPGIELALRDGVVTLRGVDLETDAGRRATAAVEAVDGVVAVRTTPRDETRSLTVSVPATEMEVLTEEECMALLRSHSLGRIALVDHGQPLIFPVNYAVDDRAVVFRTAPGMKLTEGPMSKVAFEIDGVDEATGTAWSVMVRGVAYEITQTLDSLSERLRALVVEPMAPGDRKNWMSVMRQETSGRRFRLRPAASA